MNNSPIPLDSATIILLREAIGEHFEIYLMRRHRNHKFMGGAYVFPGGKLDKEDCIPELFTYGNSLSIEEVKQSLQEPDIPEEKAFGLFFNAIRETFEEAGILFAYKSSGEIINFSDADTRQKFAGYRLQIYEKKLSLYNLAKMENLQYSLDLLSPYSHWITPEIESKRFNTRFLLGIAPMGQVAAHDNMEMTESKWITPSNALKEHNTGKILLMPPTLKTIEELNEFHSTDSLIDSTKSRKINIILPQAFIDGEIFGVKLPHDPDYTIKEFKIPLRPGEPSRIAMRDGKWRTEYKG